MSMFVCFMITSQSKKKIWVSCPSGLQPVGELGQRPLVVDHAELPYVATHLRLILVRLANVRVYIRKGRWNVRKTKDFSWWYNHHQKKWQRLTEWLTSTMPHLTNRVCNDPLKEKKILRLIYETKNVIFKPAFNIHRNSPFSQNLPCCQ